MISAEQIKLMIETGLPGSQATVKGDDGVHFEAVIVCDGFAGKNEVQRHRMVFATLGDKMDQAIHALSFKTYTQEEINQ